MTIIDQLRSIIKDGDVSQYQIAKDTGVSAPVLSRFVRGKRCISFETAATICAYLKLTITKTSS